ncbi:sigma-70 family RNA polymerase sigma factor [bacterium]|nr:sigma-70 family RNA polymerase sigma factor [bacterium]
MPAEENLTIWLGKMSAGDDAALDHVMRLLYDEIRLMARQRLRDERADHTLAATALVNEVYLKLAAQRRIDAADRIQFLGVAAVTMRRVLVDYARTRTRAKRGGGERPVPLEDAEPFLSVEECDEILALDAAMERLAALDERAARVVEQRFYAGLSVEETAQLLGVSTKTVQREWVAARAWLRKEVARELGVAPDPGAP